MIVDLDLRGHRALVIGAGSEAYRRTRALLAEGCDVLVIGEPVDSRLESIADGHLTIRRERISDATPIRNCGARIVIAATSDPRLNAAIVDAARLEPNCLAYSADDATNSDFAHVATADLSPSVKIAVSTNGKSPVMAASLRERTVAALDGLVTGADDAQIELQAAMRAAARSKIPTPSGRRRLLRAIAADEEVKQLIKDGQAGAARDKAMSILEAWKDD